MESKELQARLDIIRLAIEVEDIDTIIIQTTRLKSVNSNKIQEIIKLLNRKSFKQAQYLIKNYMQENMLLDENSLSHYDETEKVLSIEDMLKLSPLAKETIRNYKSSLYTQDDLEAFAKKIEIPNEENSNFKEIEPEELNEENIKNEDNIKTEDINENVEEAIENADKDTPLDEISKEVLAKKEKENRTNIINKYKTLRSKFAKKDNENNKELGSNKKSSVANVIDKAKKITKKLKIEEANNIENEDKSIPKAVDKSAEIKQYNDDEIYSPIPHIEQKFRQAFILFPPNKESEVWIEEVIKFLKYISANSYTEKDVKTFLDEYEFYLSKNDIARAAQVLLLAAVTDSKFAKFLLARELFNGRVLKRDLKKSFTLMKQLANEFYPDAICDLAQFYEFGIGVPKDKKIALKLYEKAFELGVDRATKHINRIKESKGFLSSILKFK